MSLNHCLIGYPLDKTLSPFIHSYFFSTTGINGGYTAFELKEDVEIPILLHFLERFKFTGINVTSPHKQAILNHVENMDESVKAIGVANTLKMTEKGWCAYNTDCEGFYRQLCLIGGDYKNNNILVIGAGGASRAVIWALAKAGVKKITILNRSDRNLDSLVNLFSNVKFNFIKYEDLKEDFVFDMVINTASVDWSNELWLERFMPHSRHLVTKYKIDILIDLQYTKSGKTGFLDLWGGNKKFDGFTMLVEQAAYAFEIWCGIKPVYSIDQLRGFILSRRKHDV